MRRTSTRQRATGHRGPPTKHAATSHGGGSGAGLRTALGLLVYSALTNRHEGRQGWYVARNVVAAGGMVAWARRCGLTWLDLGLDRSHLPRGLDVGLRASAVGLAAVATGIPTASGRPAGRRLLADRRAAVSSRSLTGQALIRIPVGTAAFEEIAFRGVLLGLVAARHGPRIALIVSSAVFGLWHIPPTLAALRLNDVTDGRIRASLGAVALTSVAGLVFGGLRVAGGHVAASWCPHWTINAAALLLAARWQRSVDHGTVHQ